MRILLIEDDSATAQTVELMLKSEGFNIYTTDLGEEGVDLAKVYDYDLVLLDLCLPDISGFDVLRRLRGTKINTPILILSRSAEIDTKVRTLGGGADDYMSKPFHKDELVARIHAVVRRSKGHPESAIKTGNVVVNLDSKTVTVKEKQIRLTGKEYQILELLSLRKGTTLTKEMFLNHLYGGMDEPELKIIDVFICKLRKKIAAMNDGFHDIETVWGRGYVLHDPIEGVEREPKPSLSEGTTDSSALTKPPNGFTQPVYVAKVLKVTGPVRLHVLREHPDLKQISLETALQQLRGKGYAVARGPRRQQEYGLTAHGDQWLESVLAAA